MSEPLIFEYDSGIALIRFNRPRVHNAVDDAMMAALEETLHKIQGMAYVRCIVLTGTGEQSFCSGGDLRYFDSLKSREQGKAMSLRMQSILTRLYDGKHPVIAAINGDAYGGGCEILTACHLRVAVKDASFAFRQAVNGVTTGWGGGVRALQLLGRGAAMHLLLTSEKIDAEEAHRIGLVDYVVPRGELMMRCLALAEMIAANSNKAVTSFLDIARCLERRGESAAISRETELFADCWVGEDFRRTLKRWQK